jgi:hypothetical protein
MRLSIGGIDFFSNKAATNGGSPASDGAVYEKPVVDKVSPSKVTVQQGVKVAPFHARAGWTHGETNW